MLRYIYMAAFCTIFAAIVGLAFTTRQALGADPAILRIGTLQSLMEEVAPSKREAFTGTFHDLVKDFTGRQCVVLSGADAQSGAKQLDDGKWNLGVFQGVEFAWVQSKHPKLKPLMVAKTAQPLKAVLVGPKDKNISFADLKGKDISILLSKLHCRLFADKGAGGKASTYFGKMFQTRSGEDALDNVLLGKVQAAIVDTMALETYRQINPGRMAKLKIDAQSPVFPPTAIVYKEGTLSDELLNTLKNGMFKANKSDRGREAMSPFQIKEFAPVPADYQQELSAILKDYPAPAH